VVDREEKHSEVEERDIGIVLQIKVIPCTEEKEKYHHLSLVEEYPLHPTQVRLCVEPTTPCASLRTKVIFEALSIIVSEGSRYIGKGSQSSGISTPNQNHLVSP
jgi:hypothetical protein